MNVYTADEHSDQIQYVFFWLRSVTWRATKAAIWLGFARCGLELGLGYVDLVRIEGDRITSTETRHYYGPILTKFKESKSCA